MAVSDSERKIDVLKKDNEELRSRLHELQINSDDTTPSSGGNEEYKKMQGEISDLKKDFEMLQEKYKRVNIVSDQISTWAKRVYTKFVTMTPDAPQIEGKEDMVQMFGQMSGLVKSELARLEE